MSDLDITIPGVPTAKGRPRFSRKSGRTYTPAATEKAEQSLQARAYAVLREQGVPIPLHGPLAVEIDLSMRIPASWSRKRRDAALLGAERPTSRPDLDNLVKLVMDALNGIGWVDDAQVVEGTFRKFYGSEPCTRIRIRKLGGSQ